MSSGEYYDVIIVGGGNSALSAALSAQEQGARVLVLEKAPEANRGGNTRFTSLYRFAYNGKEDIKALVPHISEETWATMDVAQYTTDEFYNDLMRVSGGRADPAFSEVLVSESYAGVKWYVDNGVKWDVAWDLGRKANDGIIRFEAGMPTRASGGGVEVFRVLYPLIQSRGGTILYETKATRLLTNEAGRVVGVKVKDKNGYRDITGKAVVLASGGFQASPEMRTKYLGPGWDMVKVRGTRFDTGEGLLMALEQGAATTGQFSGCHACQAFFEGPDFEMGELAFAHGYLNGILVNVEGKRFIDEAEDFDLYTYAKLGRSVLAQPRNIGYQIYDQKVTEVLFHGYNKRYKVAKPITADSLEELARKIDIDEENFLATVRQFNAAVREDIIYDPSILDGKCTEGIEPRKSNWSLKIDTPPFLAYPVTCGLTFTFGGVKTDTDGRVIDTEGNAIPSLYAAGEIVGSFYFNYAGASGLIKGLIFGRRAGRCAAGEPPL